jgi:hypothetical protein
MTHFNRNLSRSLVLGAAVSLLAACGGGGGDSGSTSKPTSRLKLSVTDAPVDDAQAVWVQFRAVEFKPEGAEPVRQDLKDANGAVAPQRINLLPLQDGRAAVLLDGVVLPAGRYEWLRLLVDNEPNVRDSYLEIAGNECELRIPSGDESGLKLTRGFTLPEQGALALTVDFDLRKSIHAPPGQQGSGVNCTQAYQMKPVLRLVQDAEVGGISGTVANALIADAACARLVYVFADAAGAAAGSTTPDDYDGTPPDPVVMAKVDQATGAYKATFLPAGNYTLAFTCSVDKMDANDALVFSAPKGATVRAGVVTTGVNFQ